MDNRRRLFLASFVTLLAAGIGFAIRGSILDDWAAAYGFTKSELGQITGMGFTGFGVTIIVFSTIAERIGYARLMRVAFALHVLSAVVTFLATPIFHAAGKPGAFWCLNIGVFLFALANGTCESVINPLTATLYPHAKTHYLNILHAGWPGGLILGSVFAFLLDGRLRWEGQLALFMIPTVAYGVMILGQTFPTSEARAAGATFASMLRVVLLPTFVALIALHALVGYVELGTDMWIAQITSDILADPKKGILLFMYTSGLMFGLRFVAGPIVHRISSLGLLLASAVLGAVGLVLLGSAATGVACVVAVTVYGLGKTFLWPTMLGVASERFPRGGALALGTLGGVGMISAGLLGGPGIGYKQDYYAAEKLRAEAPATFSRYESPDRKRFLLFPAIAGLDGAKVGALVERPEAQLAPAEREDRRLVKEANLHGGRMALKWTALVPVTMALGYAGLMLAFARRRTEETEPTPAAAIGTS
jgi:MFS family permease